VKKSNVGFGCEDWLLVEVSRMNIYDSRSRRKWLVNRFKEGFLCSVLLLSGAVAQAQIVPDETLGSEQSSIAPRVLGGDLIEGGAIRGSNLFHSFRNFNVGDGTKVYFANPTGIQNILTRVTGSNASNVNGTLGVDGAANLFLLNPNGILFGKDARLDVRGSFVGSTANGIRFGEQGEFNATNPQAPSLLTVQPSALLFTQINPGTITSKSSAPVGQSPIGTNLFGLRVPDGQSFLLVGGDVEIDGGGMNGGVHAVSGRVELGGLAGVGAISLDSQFRLTFPSEVTRSNLSLSNTARVSVRGTGGGNIAVNTNKLTATGGGRLNAGTEGSGNAGDITINANIVNLSGMTSDFVSGFSNQSREEATGKGGNIIVNTNQFTLAEGARLDTGAFGRGDGGSTIINAKESINIDGGFIYADVLPNAIAQAGEVRLKTELLTLQNSGRVDTSTSGQGSGGNIWIETGVLGLSDEAQISTSTLGRGNGGNISITARERVSISGTTDSIFSSSIFTDVAEGAVGKGGDLRINTGRLSLTNAGQIVAGTAGQGDGGKVIINARDIQLQGIFKKDDSFFFSGILSRVRATGNGNAGEIQIDAGTSSINDGAAIVATTNGRGNAGNITIRTNRLAVDGQTPFDNQGSLISTLITSKGVGQGGNIDVAADTVTFTNGAQINTGTSGEGNGGNLTINARNVTFQGARRNSDGSTNPGGIFSNVEKTAIGNMGEIQISTNTLSLLDGATISTSTRGRGDAGKILINARNRVDLSGSEITSTVSRSGVGQAGDIQIKTEVLTLFDDSSIRNGTDGEGNAGSIRIDANSLTMGRTRQSSLPLTNAISANTSRNGNAGNIAINVRDGLTLENSSISSLVQDGGSQFELRGRGKGGELQISAGSIQLTNDSQITSNSSGQGSAGNISIQARDAISVEDSQISSTIASSGGSSAVGNAGNIYIEAGSLSVRNGSNIFSFTNAQGNAGNIDIRTRGQVVIDRGDANITGIVSGVFPDGIGKGGNVTIFAESLLLNSAASVLTATIGKGDAGRILVQVEDQVSLRRGSQLNSSSVGQGSAGSISVQADNILIDGVNTTQRSGIFSTIENQAIGQAKDIDVTANSISITDGGAISASTLAQGNAGNILLNVRDRIFVSGAYTTPSNERLPSAISTGGLIDKTAPNRAVGNAGSIIIRKPNLLEVRDGGAIFVGNEGTGESGNIDIQARALLLNRGIISAETANRNGGNIFLQLDALSMRNRSSISTTAGTAQAGGNGGNINISAGAIVAPSKENSDITANAFTGQGGNVQISTDAIFGIEARSQQTLESDITATSQRGVQGSIAIAQPNVQRTQGTIELPSSILDASNQIAQVCPRDPELAKAGKFTVSGTGSLPPNPINPLTSNSTPSPLATLESTPSNHSIANTTPKATSPPIIEAQSWIKTRDGKVILVAHTPETTPPVIASCPTPES
jgi:filamentous hemagglutinin family protein